MAQSFDELSPEQQYFAHIMFKVKVLQANGQAFEDLFTAVMSRRDSRFQQVKPQGSIGDKGNDGFIPEEGRYFQVHAPEDPKDKAQTAADKAGDDFRKLKENWKNIKDYRFVFNDKYLGVFPTILQALAAVKSSFRSLEVCRAFVAKDLENEFTQLSVPDMQAVLQSVIPRPENIDDIDYAALTEILKHIVDSQQPIPGTGLPEVPEFQEKITFNDINGAAALLNIGNFQDSAVESYFNRHADFTKTDIRNRLAQSYANAKAAVGDGDDVGDSVFFNLLQDIAPEATKVVQDAAIVLIAYFFEKCDVFEDPSK